MAFAALAGSFAAFAKTVPARQDTARHETQADPQVKQAARGLIEEVLQISHAAEIFAICAGRCARFTFPLFATWFWATRLVLRPPTPRQRRGLAKVLTFLDYAAKRATNSTWLFPRTARP